MSSAAAFLERAHLPLIAVLLIAGIGLAAASRDLMKRLLGASAAMIAATAYLAVITGGGALGGALLAAIVLSLAASALGFVVLVRIREGFASVDAQAVRAGIEDDAARAEREA